MSRKAVGSAKPYCGTSLRIDNPSPPSPLNWLVALVTTEGIGPPWKFSRRWGGTGPGGRATPHGAEGRRRDISGAAELFGLPPAEHPQRRRYGSAARRLAKGRRAERTLDPGILKRGAAPEPPPPPPHPHARALFLDFCCPVRAMALYVRPWLGSARRATSARGLQGDALSGQYLKSSLCADASLKVREIMSPVKQIVGPGQVAARI